MLFAAISRNGERNAAEYRGPRERYRELFTFNGSNEGPRSIRCQYFTEALLSITKRETIGAITFLPLLTGADVYVEFS